MLSNALKVLIFVLPVSALLLPKPLSLLYTLLLLVTLYGLFVSNNNRSSKLKFKSYDKCYLVAILLYLLSYIGSSIANHIDFYTAFSTIDKHLRLASILLIIVFFRAKPKLISNFNNGVLLTLAIGFVAVLYEFVILKSVRVSLGHNAIYLGVAYMLLSVYGVHVVSKFRKYSDISLLVLVCFNLFVQATNLTRTSWLCMPIFLIYAAYSVKNKKPLYSGLAVSVLAFGSLFVYKDKIANKVIKRLELASSEVSRCIYNGDCESSVGWRIVMWENSINMAKENPWFGVGPDQYKKVTKELIKAGIARSSDPVTFNHTAHSNYFTYLAVFGVLGLMAFILISFITPLMYMYSNQLSLLALILIICFSIIGLTSTWAENTKSITLLNLLLATAFEQKYKNT